MKKSCETRKNRKCVQKRPPRPYKPCDAARIARNCWQNQGYSQVEVLACVANALGYEYIAVPDRPDADKEQRLSIDSALVRQLESARDKVNEFLAFFGIEG